MNKLFKNIVHLIKLLKLQIHEKQTITLFNSTVFS